MKKRRLELGLYQKEVARRLSVNESTITTWELDRSRPALRFIPTIVQFFGYIPDLDLPQDLSPEIIWKRRVLGLRQKMLQDLLRVDSSALARWKRGLSKPSTVHLKRPLHWMREFGLKLHPTAQGVRDNRGCIQPKKSSDKKSNGEGKFPITIIRIIHTRYSQ